MMQTKNLFEYAETASQAYLNGVVNCLSRHADAYADMFDMSFYGAKKGPAFYLKMHTFTKESLEFLCFCYEVWLIKYVQYVEKHY